MAAWQDFTGRMQSLSARMPALRSERARPPRSRSARTARGARSERATRRVADLEWEQVERAQDLGFSPLETPLPEVPDGFGTPAVVPDANLDDLPALPGVSAVGSRRPLWQRQLSYRLLVLLTVASLLLGCIGTSSIVRLADAVAAARDAKAQVALIEAILKGGAVTEPATLSQVRTHLVLLGSDLDRLQGDTPVGWFPGTAGLGHLLTMGRDLVQAGTHGIDAAIVVVPALKAALHGIGGESGTSGQASGAPAAPALTLAQAQQAQQNVAVAVSDVRQALVERQGVSDGDLERIGLGALVPTLAKLDHLTPQLQKGLDLAQVAMGALPELMGLTKPINYLLFNQDSDELRATGGFLGNYAVLSLAGGRLTGGVHLHDIISLDCPYGNCYNRPNPAPIANWFFTNHNYITNTTQFGIRDSNYDPDFPSFARLAEKLGQEEGLPQTGGVIAITPALIKSFLQITGPIKVPDFNQTVDANNLQDSIHYFHILAAICQNEPTYPHCGELYAAGSGSQLGTSQRKAFDAVLGSAVLHAVANLQGKQQSELIKAISTALKTKDLQIYFNNSQMEALMGQLNDNGAVISPQGDSVFAVDMNTGATYWNGDIQQQINDTVTFDSKGNATHDMTINYKFPIVTHSWSEMFHKFGLYYVRDVLRVIVPKNADLKSMTGCSPVDTTTVDTGEAGRAVWACAFQLDRSNSLTVHMKWTVPSATKNTGSATQYALLYQKQAGTHATLNLTIIPPKGATVKSAQTPLKAGSPAPRVAYTGPLTGDTTFDLSYTG